MYDEGTQDALDTGLTMAEDTDSVTNDELDLDFDDGGDDMDDGAEDAAEPDEAPAGDEGGEDAPPEGDGEKPAEEPVFTVTVNHQEVKLTESELKTLAQKGMNYDRVHAQLQAVRDDRTTQVLAQYAQQSGMSVPDYLAMMEQGLDNAKVQQLMSEGGMTEEVARRHLDMEKRLARQEAAEKRAAAEKQQANAYVPLIQKYPDVKELPGEVAMAIEQGSTPLDAYENWLRGQENAKLKAEIAALKADKKNRTTAPGSAKGMAADPQDNDPFWAGWNSV